MRESLGKLARFMREHWVAMASITLAVLPVIRTLLLPAFPCRPRPPKYWPTSYYDPVDYAELIANHPADKCALIINLFFFVLVASVLLLIVAEGRRAIALTGALVGIFWSASLCGYAFLSIMRGGTSLTTLDSIEFDGRRYHLTEAGTEAGGLDVYIHSLILHECNLDDTECYGREIVGGLDGRDMNVDNAAFVINDERNQLEVWAQGSLIIALDSSMIPLPESYELFPAITPSNVDKIGEISTLSADVMRILTWSPRGDALAAMNSERLWMYSFQPDGIRREVHYLESDDFGASDARWTVDFPSTEVSDYDYTIYQLQGDNSLQLIVSEGIFAISPQGRVFAVQYRDGERFLYDVSQQRILVELEEINWRSSAYAFGPGEEVFAFTDEDGEGRTYLRLVDLQSGSEIANLQGFNYDYHQKLVFTPDGATLFTFAEVDCNPGDIFSESGNFLYAWDVFGEAMRYEVKMPEESGRIQSLDISPDGTLVATASADGIIRLWNVASGELITQFLAHSETVTAYPPFDATAVAFSPDGRMLATSGEDRTVRLWGVSP